MSSENKNSVSFKYNMSFYYQSTIIYFVAFALYLIIRGEFVEDSFKLITRDPILYFFAIIVLISLVSLFYNLYKDKHLIIGEDGITFETRFGKRNYSTKEILTIKIARQRGRAKSRAFRLVRIRLKHRRRPLLIRPYDYENEADLIKKFVELKEELEKK